jgi:predicted transposase YbfD/YdcC
VTTNNKINKSRIKSLFKNIPDPRVDRTKYHPLESILYIVLCGTMAGVDSWIGYADYAEAHQEELGKIIDLSSGIPSHDTIGRVVSLLDIESFAVSFEDFTSNLVDKSKGVIAIDGKTMRGSDNKRKNISAKHIVSAWADCCKCVIGQVKTNEKSNEITAIPELLNMLDIEGQIITIDAMGCQRDICNKILSKGGDYVISLKGNQGSLHSEIKEYFGDESLPITNEWEEFDKGHGRIEHRICKTLDDIDWLQKNHKWPGLKSVAMVNSIVDIDNKITNETRYYISSLPANAEKIAKAARSHWSIENKLHWVLDATWNEDKSSIRKDNAPEIINMMRKWALNIINQHKGSLSIKRMTNKIAMSSKFLMEIMEKI